MDDDENEQEEKRAPVIPVPLVRRRAQPQLPKTRPPVSPPRHTQQQRAGPSPPVGAAGAGVFANMLVDGAESKAEALSLIHI